MADERPVVRLPRSKVFQFLCEATRDPEYIFSTTGPRRTDLLAREEPPDDHKQGKLIKDANGKNIILEPAGTVRKMIVRRRFVDPKTGMLRETKHHKPTGGSLKFDPTEKGLFGPVGGMYPDFPKLQPNGEVMTARYGQWRPFAFVDMLTVQEIENKGQTFVVVDDETDEETLRDLWKQQKTALVA